jgi:hypothetical protein
MKWTIAMITAGLLLFGMAGSSAGQTQSTDPEPTAAGGDPCPDCGSGRPEPKSTEPEPAMAGEDPCPDCGSGRPEPKSTEPPPQVLDIQAGASLSPDKLTLIACVESVFVGPLSAQVCGSGRGLFLDKHDPAPELTQYRARLRWARASWGRLWLTPIVQAGMSELRAGTMDAGYLPGRGSSRQLALGPAVGAALQLVWPLGKGLELVGDIHLEAAYIPRAGDLELPQAELQPTLGATLGIGF